MCVGGGPGPHRRSLPVLSSPIRCAPRHPHSLQQLGLMWSRRWPWPGDHPAQRHSRPRLPAVCVCVWSPGPGGRWLFSRLTCCWRCGWGRHSGCGWQVGVAGWAAAWPGPTAQGLAWQCHGLLPAPESSVQHVPSLQRLLYYHASCHSPRSTPRSRRYVASDGPPPRTTARAPSYSRRQRSPRCAPSPSAALMHTPLAPLHPHPCPD